MRTSGKQASGRKSWRERQAARREKRQQVDKCYREHTPPQVRLMRQENWMKRINPEPQFVPFEGETYPCPAEGCGARFGRPDWLRKHVAKRHYPRVVPG